MADTLAINDPRLKAILGAAAPIDPIAAPALSSTIAMPQPSVPAILNPVGQSYAPPTQTQTDTSERNRLLNSGDGISQIKNPLLRGVARTADIAASVLSPFTFGLTGGLARALPGTMEHHDMLVRQQTNKLAQDQAIDKETAQTANETATTAHTVAATNALENPRDKFTPIQTDSGFAAFDPSTGRAAPVVDAAGNQVGTPEKAIKPQSIEQQAYDFAVKSGKNPLDAYAAVYGAKNTKDAGLPQQLLDAISSGDNTKADLIRKVYHDTQVVPKIEVHAANAPAVPSFALGAGGAVNPTIQAYIDGRIPAPNARTKQGAEIMRQITAADPTYDASRYNTYQAAQKDATSGKTGTAINSLNTIQEHIGRALQNIPKNGSSPFLNSIENTIGDATGANPTGKFDVDATGIAGEWGKLVAGGVASEGEQKHVQALLNKNGSPKQIRDNLEEVRQMTLGKLQGIQKQIQSASHPGGANNPINSLPGNADKVDGHWDPVAKKVVYY
jgi:hypothetical protein